MSKPKELKYTDLRRVCNPSSLAFKSTSELLPLEGIIGQDRAVRALEFGLKINTKGYNIFMCGPTGTGKTSYAHNYIKTVAATKKNPDDWCYVYNFEKENEPVALNLPAGMGKCFQKDMDEFVKILQQEISKAFDTEDYEKEKAIIVKEYHEKKSKLLERLNADAEKQSFKVKTTNTGIYFLPIIEGKALNEQEYGNLDDEFKHKLNEKSDTLQIETVEIIKKIKNIEKEAESKVIEWESKIALFAVGVHINDLKQKYSKYKKIASFLEKIQEDILDNLDEFRDEECDDEQALIIPWIKKSSESTAGKYKVNLLVDNSELKGAPVIVDYNPTYYNLLGKYEYENEFGSVSTDFSLIKAGLFHQANSGFLILQAKDVLSNIQSWECLKRALRTKQISVENLKEQMGLVSMSTLKPEPIPIDIKVILVGNEQLYHLLYEFDEDFSKLFKVKVDFEEEMDWNENNIQKLAQFISSFCQRDKTLHFDKTGVAKVIEYSSRLISDQRKLSTRFNDIVEILSESCVYAQIAGAKIVKACHVIEAMQEKIYRCNKYDKKLLELLENGTIMIDTDNSVIGQINGLTILDMGDFMSGKPSRITANTFMGESGIVNIEREIEMSGTSHSKGVLILSGYIGQKYAQEIPLSLTASLCFEQLYSGVDGDSASSAELYAVLSSLADVPIKQYIAVTGSVNQKGEIQPIGGATEKIEGFFELCKLRGLNEKHGVIIPYQNIKNLVLNDEVIDAVKKGLFHIYPVKTIDEGIEILTGIPAGKKQTNGSYSKNTINYKIYDKLKTFAEIVAGFGKEEIRPRRKTKNF